MSSISYGPLTPENSIPDNYNACVTCNDTLKEYVRYIFELFFFLEDENGDRIMVSVDEKVRIKGDTSFCSKFEYSILVGTALRNPAI